MEFKDFDVLALNVSVVPDHNPYGPVAQYSGSNFVLKVNPLETMTKYEAMSLAMHEANPGHHLEAVTRKSLRGVPDFIKHPMRSRSNHCIIHFRSEIGMFHHFVD